MLNEQILSTLRFFDLQNLPLTAFEVHKFLIADTNSQESAPVPLDQIMETLEGLVQTGQVIESLGFYCLPGRESLVQKRLRDYLHALPRERLISRYARKLRNLPFIRGVALAGSQTLGEHKPNSDIDLLVITDAQFMWTARVFITAFLGVLGLRRHGGHITNRFCLNHYVAGPKSLVESRNLYTAMEYLKLRTLVSPETLHKFQQANLPWLETKFANAGQHLINEVTESRSKIQTALEFLFRNDFGRYIEKTLGRWQLKRIRIGEDILVREDELSFHPDSKQAALLRQFSEVDKKASLT